MLRQERHSVAGGCIHQMNVYEKCFWMRFCARKPTCCFMRGYNDKGGQIELILNQTELAQCPTLEKDLNPVAPEEEIRCVFDDN